MLCCMFRPRPGPHKSSPLSPLDPHRSGDEAEACSCRQTPQLKAQPSHASPRSFRSQRCTGTALSEPPGSRVGARWIGLIYAPRGAAGKFNDPLYCQHHGALFLEGHRDVMKMHAAPGRGALDAFEKLQSVSVIAQTSIGGVKIKFLCLKWEKNTPTEVSGPQKTAFCESKSISNRVLCCHSRVIPVMLTQSQFVEEMNAGDFIDMCKKCGS